MFNCAAERANVNSILSIKLSRRCIRICCKKIFETFARDNVKAFMMSGVGGGVREIKEHLSTMLLTRKDLAAAKDADLAPMCAQEKWKKDVGRESMTKPTGLLQSVDGVGIDEEKEWHHEGV